jgi:hypothetical protein
MPRYRAGVAGVHGFIVEVALGQVAARLQLVGRARPDHAAFFDDVVAIEQEAISPRFLSITTMVSLAFEARRQRQISWRMRAPGLGGLVQHQQQGWSRRGRWPASAARPGEGARRLAAALAQALEQRHRARASRPCRPGPSAPWQAGFPPPTGSRTPPPLRHQAQAQARHRMRASAPGSCPAARRGRRAQHAHERAHGGGLAHAVAADQRDGLAGLDLEVHAEQHLAAASRR